MKKVALALVIATLSAGTPAAQATSCIHVWPTAPFFDVHVADCKSIPANVLAEQHLGGCRLTAVRDEVAGEGQMTGEIDIETLVFSADPRQNPLHAAVSCYVLVNGARQAGAEVSAEGDVIVAGGGVVTYASNDDSDFVQLCQDIRYSNGVTQSECFEVENAEAPPPVFWEVVHGAICPYLVMLAGSYGPVFIDGADFRPGGIGGDIYIGGVLVYDCPVEQ